MAYGIFIWVKLLSNLCKHAHLNSAREVFFTLSAFRWVTTWLLLSLYPFDLGRAAASLRYGTPAERSGRKALPLGNGRIGAMLFGGVQEEHLQINEDTLWGGGPHDYTNPDAYSHLSELRQLVFAGKVKEADGL